MKINKKAVALFLLFLVVEIGIALFIHDRFVRPYVGDVLVVVVVYCCLRIFLRADRLLPLWIFIFAAAVEFSQYLNVADLLGLWRYPVLATVFGATFDWLDLLCYGIGCGILFVAQTYAVRRKKTKDTLPFQKKSTVAISKQ